MSSENSRRKHHVLSTLGVVVLVLATIYVIWLAAISAADFLLPIFPSFGSGLLVLFGILLSFIGRPIMDHIEGQWWGEYNRKTYVIIACVAFGITALLMLFVAWLISVVWLAFA